MDEITAFDIISIKIASPQVIRSWSKGEVKKAETINYRTLKPEKDGLFCEKIFGPVHDDECNCGKYKGKKFRGITCDRCQVTVDEAKVRRIRMGHIELATPVTHIWFFKAVPSRLAALLDIGLRDLEKVIYYEEYIVTDPGLTPLKRNELLSEDKYQEALSKYGTGFKAKIGAEAVRELLKEIDLDTYYRKVYKELEKSKDILNNRKTLKTLKIIDDFRKSGNKPEWMVLEVLPVIPPDLRPLVPLDGGRFATSDLNDLYRRVINRNNRLRKLMELNAPEIIIRNEKRMLQEAVDALLDNGRHGRPVMGANNRPLKSLSDMLKGKQGRFRQNLLGKRVDYSGRSVIVVGPELKLHECGLPKQMALELFEPFIIKKLKEKGFVHTIRGARRMVERGKIEVWDILDEVIKDHPVLLNRAPTLHRLGVQAFQPVLIEGKSIKIHPLVCTAFNADFDGDQMAVHVPLSLESQIETKILILSINNIFSPADGRPIVTPTQDIILGTAYLSKEKSGLAGENKIFANSDEVVVAFEDKAIALHTKIKLRVEDGVFDLDEKKYIPGKQIITTTVGRAIFNQELPQGFGFVNKDLNKGNVSLVVTECFKRFGQQRTIELLDAVKRLGFRFATMGGISIGIDDLKVPEAKPDVLKGSREEVAKVEEQYRRGIITDSERSNKVIAIWTHATDRISDLLFKGMDSFNPIFMMADSGARGSRLQVRQLAGMRGLMAKPSGEIIENPITANFREGLTVLEYFISTHGARKGLADTALKTADAGYLTRRLVDVAQEVIVTDYDCQTLNGITVSPIIEGDEVVVSLKDRIVGRVALDNVVDIITDRVIVEQGSEITEEKAEMIEKLGIEKIRIRSVLTCEAGRGVCCKCYGINLATGRLVEVGEAAGVIAAQSIGEPGTQLTMRTFHIGGTASRIVEQSYIKSKNKGEVKYHSLRVTAKNKEFIVLNRNGSISINDKQGRELERYPVPQGAFITVTEGTEIVKDIPFVRWDPYTMPILAEVSGKVKFEDLKENITIREELNPVTKLVERVVVEHKQEFHPQIIVVDEKDEVMGIYPIPVGAHILVKDGEKHEAGDLLAKIPRLVAKTRDITGGLPRVAELFEARRPKDPAVISEIDGFVEFGEVKRGQRVIIIKSLTGMQREYVIPHGKHPNVYKGDKVVAGQQLTDGPVVLQDILRVCGDKVLQEYLVNEVQEVYRLQGVRINDKHIEVIIRQMLKKVKIEESGDTGFLAGEQIDKWNFHKENVKLAKKAGKPATATPLLLGITKASLTTDSFISAASFQETTRVLTEAATSGKSDELFGLKENVIVGHLIPSGTGFRSHRSIEIQKIVQQKKEELKEEKEAVQVNK